MIRETKQLEVKEIIEKMKDIENKKKILEIDVHNMIKEWVLSELSLKGSGFNWTVYIGNKEAGEVSFDEENNKIYFVQT